MGKILYETNPEIKTVRAKFQCFLDYVEDGGTFSLAAVYDALGAKTTEQKANIRQGILREKQAGSIESAGSYGIWRKIDSLIEWQDLSQIKQDAPERLDVRATLNLDKIINFFPGDMMAIAGLSSCGKTAGSIETGMKTLGMMKINYFSSEITLAGIQDRAQKEGINLQSLKGFRFAMRSDNFQDVIEPGALNIVDYVTAPSVGDEPRYFVIPHLLSKIHQTLKGEGMVIVCLQKDPGKRSGEGGFKTYHKANLYLTLDQDDQGQYWANIEKCKVRPDLQGYRMKYKPQPFSLMPLSDWIPPKRK